MKLLTREAVEAAVQECDQAGSREAFRSRYGFHSSRRYKLVVGGFEYDTKPIVAAAFRHIVQVGRALRPSEFVGGASSKSTAASALEGLGFEVRVLPAPYSGWPGYDEGVDLWTEEEGADEVIEGRQRLSSHLQRERRSAGIAKALKRDTLRAEGVLACAVCKFDFAESYGSHGLGYIEAHHIVPLSECRDEIQTSRNDLALVCANCHRMLHRHGNLTIQDLAQRVTKTRKL